MDDVQFLSAVLFFISSITAGCVIQWGVSKIRVYKPPVSILWFLFGIVICLLELLVIPRTSYPAANGHDDVEINVSPHSALGLISIGIAEASRMPHNALYYVVLPILLYDATQLVHWHHFKKNIKTGVMLAVSGIVLQVFVLGALMQWSFSKEPVNTSSAVSAPSRMMVMSIPDAIDLPDFGANITNFESYYTPSYRRRFLADRFFGEEDGDLLGEGDNDTTEDSDPSFASSCMIAAAVGATDPIAVLGVLESLDAPAHLVSLFDSESLINDGTAIFMFSFFKSMSRDGGVSWGEAVKEFFLLLLGGPLVGLVCAAVLYRCIKHFRFHPFDITLLVVAVSYLVFFVAEIYLKTSAPLAIVVYGLYFKAYAKAAFEAETSNVHHTFVRGLATAMTSLVFIISGIACMRITWDTLTGAQNLEVPTSYPKFVESAGMPTSAFTSVAVETAEVVGALPWKRMLAGSATTTRRKLAEIASTTAIRDLWHVPVFYLFCNLARAFMILVLSPLINKDLGSFSWKEAVLLWWGGLRGGVCLILALLIEQDEDIPDGLASKAALYCASAVFLILVINGTTFEFLFRWLKPYKANPFKEIYLLKVLKFIDEEFEHEANLLQSHWLYQNTNILEYSSRLVPVLGDSEMHDMKGLQIPPIHVRAVMRSFDIHKLITPSALGNIAPPYSDVLGGQVASSVTLVTSMNGSSVAQGRSDSPESPERPLPEEQARSITAPAQAGLRDLEMNGDDVGHQTAAKIQNLQNIRHEVDVLKTVEKLHLVPDSDSEDNEKRQTLTERNTRLHEPPASPLRKIKSAHQPSSPMDGGVDTKKSLDDIDLERSKLRTQGTFDQFTFTRNGSAFPTWSPEVAKSAPRGGQTLAPLDEEDAYETIRSSLPSDISATGGGSPMAEGTSAAECLPPKTSDEKRVRWSSMKPDESCDEDSVSVSPQAPISARRHPLYKTGGYVYRIRSEPYSTNLDAANLERLPMRQASPPTRLDGAAFPESTGIMGGEGDWASYFLNPEHIPRTMSVPDNVGGPYKYPKKGRASMADGPRTAKRISDHKDGSAQRRDPRASVRPWHREGEVVMMVVNSMRHLYRRMYEQNFISGTCLVFFMGNNDVMNDYAIAEEGPDKGRQYFRLLEQMTLLDICIDGRLSTDYTRGGNPLRTQQHTLQHAATLKFAAAKAKTGNRRASRISLRFHRDDSIIKKTMENVTPFDLEWYLLVGRLRLTHRWNMSLLRQLGRKCVCHQMPGDAGSQTSHSPFDTPASSPAPPGSLDGSVDDVTDDTTPKVTWRDRWQRLLVWVWALVGPRQIFPALDDLQTLCAYVDVHEEMLVRGDRGLRFILGAKLLESYSSRTARGKAAVRHLIHFYPQSLPYALICHGAVFLINLKIQLVEEYHERGLLMTSDCEAILGVLKRQIIRVTKYHPQYLFT